ncbi:rhodanese-like domain-containing protein [Alicyclobacillus fastidiosus]|uniref:Rhodanese-like domain-containing protein n=1 Tax=Alicyclobacillus fastidiosus TaxID=392011 RepID=A0ABY6ZK27_9BACL|nr:rhodanese-like domain-containing protein [Alicyclobacillus fastidiosus]WAH42434.1 rhodanese-like domain-containing protein [Alicyclobacillus fastidiosus]GMA64259.1 rhodanese-like domain-containing protein [Alicyclobacillus fastidiosus]
MAQVVNVLSLDVQERIKRGEALQVIDVREDNEVAAGKIPGAKHIPVGQIPDRMDEIDPHRQAIMVCRSGGRSAKACEFLMANGYSNVKTMMGGMTAWSWDVE